MNPASVLTSFEYGSDPFHGVLGPVGGTQKCKPPSGIHRLSRPVAILMTRQIAVATIVSNAAAAAAAVQRGSVHLRIAQLGKFVSRIFGATSCAQCSVLPNCSVMGKRRSPKKGFIRLHAKLKAGLLSDAKQKPKVLESEGKHHDGLSCV